MRDEDFNGGPRARSGPRTGTEIAQELVMLSAVLFLEARKPGPARVPLGHASQVLAEAPMHALDDVPATLLPLLADAVAALTRAGVALPEGPGREQVERVIARLWDISREVDRQ